MPTLRGVWENVIASLAVVAILAIGGLAISTVDASVPLWLVFVLVVLALLIGGVIGHLLRDRSDLPAYQADLLGEAILALRKYAAGGLQISFADLIERGVLAPAQFGLSIMPGEEIRLSILEPDETGEGFRMVYQAGHSLDRKTNFSLRRASLAGHAFETKELQWTDDVDSDQRWQPHPKADKKRRYKSLASMPILVEEDSVAVLNVVSTEPSAFLKSDLTYIELLGALISLAWNIEFAAAGSTRVDSATSTRRGT